MNRELTRREKTLLLVLIVVVLVAGYCKLILIPINDQISSYRLNMEAEQTELDANQGKMAQMQKMQKAIEEIKAAGEKRTIPQYDNSGKLMIELHEIMSDTLDYSLDCSAGTVQQDYIMLRPIVMTFLCAGPADRGSAVLQREHQPDLRHEYEHLYRGPQQRHRGDHAGHHLLRDHVLRMPWGGELFL